MEDWPIDIGFYVIPAKVRTWNLKATTFARVSINSNPRSEFVIEMTSTVTQEMQQRMNHWNAELFTLPQEL